MVCPKCDGKGYIDDGKGYIEWLGWRTALTGRVIPERKPCDCHAGQVSCSEGSERTGGVKDMGSEKRGVDRVGIVGKPWPTWL